MTKPFGKPRCKNCSKPFTPFRNFKDVCGNECAAEFAYRQLVADVPRETKVAA